MRHASLRTQCLLGFGAVLLASLAVSAFAYRAALIDQLATDGAQRSDAIVQHATEAEITANDLEARYDELLLTGSDSVRTLFSADLNQLRGQLDTLVELTARNPETSQRWGDIRSQLDQLSPAMSLTDARARFAAIHLGSTAVIGIQRQILAVRTKQAAEQDTRLQQVLVLGGAATVALGLIAAVMIAGSADRAAALLRRDIQERARVQAFTDSILNAAAEGIYAIDRHGIVAMMNASAIQMTGYTESDILGRSLHAAVHHSHGDGSPYPADECPGVLAIARGEPRHVRDEVYWRKDGTSFPVEYTLMPIVTEGVASGAVLTFHDITHQLAVERMKDEFVSVVSHELRTPLTSIRGSLGLIAAGLLGPLPERATRMVEVALNNSERLIRLVSDILDIERIESGKVDMQLRPEDSRDLVSRSIEGIASVAEAAGVQVNSRVEPITLMVDSDRILQTLVNLVGNAIKFSARGTQVTVEVRREGRQAIFSVRDEGRGIPPEKHEAIFRRFEQVDASDARQRGGTGLGLAIARSIVQSHGGKIWVESAVGKGSTFYFSVPLRPVAEAATAA